MKAYRSEIEMAENGLFLTIEATLTPDDEGNLYAAGWRFLNNGVTFDNDDNTPALYFFKPYNK